MIKRKFFDIAQPRWLMHQTLYTPNTLSFYGYEGRGLLWGEINWKEAEIDFLELRPDDKQTFQIPSCVARLPQLEALIFPSWFVSKLRVEELPTSLEVLITGQHYEKNAQSKWDKDLRLPTIKELNNGGKSHFYASVFPSLTSLTLSNSSKTIGFSEIGKCYNLKNLYISCVQDSHQLAQVSSLSSLQYLGLSYSEDNLFEGVGGFEGLTELEISFSSRLQSLVGLERFPNLEKIDLYSNSRLRDFITLAQSPSLKWIKVLECGKKWKEKGVVIERAFQAAGFQTWLNLQGTPDFKAKRE